MRYQTSWTSFCNAYDPTNLTGSCNGWPAAVTANYTRQLRWANPPSNTLVTVVTYHVPTANKLIALYQGGYVQKVDLFSTIGDPTQGAWLEPPVNPSSVPPSTTAQPSVGTVAAGGTCTTAQSGGAACNYSNASFWQFNKGQ